MTPEEAAELGIEFDWSEYRIRELRKAREAEIAAGEARRASAPCECEACATYRRNWRNEYAETVRYWQEREKGEGNAIARK